MKFWDVGLGEKGTKSGKSGLSPVGHLVWVQW